MVTLWWQRRLSGMWIGDGCGVPIVQARLRLVFQLGSDWGDTLTTHKLSCTAHRNTLDTYIVYQERWCTTVIIGKTAYTNSLREFPPIWMREKHPPILNAKSSFENLTASLQYWFEWISLCTASDISIYCKVKKFLAPHIKDRLNKFHTSPALEGGLYFILKTVALSVSNKPSNMHPHWGPSYPLD